MARFASFTLLALQWLLLLGPVQGDAVKDLQDKGRPAIDAAIAKSKTCTKEKLQVRREWYVSGPHRRHIRETNTHPQGRHLGRGQEGLH